MNMVTLTVAAAERIRHLTSDRQEGGASLWLSTVPGGCSGTGFQYDMKLNAETPTDALVFETAGVRLVVDKDSYPLLQGAEVDYEETLMKSGFVVRNPNAVSTCACGRSFKVIDDGEDFHTGHT